MNDATQPSVAQGNLAKTPFAHLILYLYQRRSSGTLIVDADANEAKVLFHRGRAVAADVARSAATLEEGLLPLCAVSDGPFTFYESDLVGSGPSILTGMFDPFAFVAEAARRHARAELIQDVLAQFATVPLSLQPAMDPTRLSLTPAEAEFVLLLSPGTVTIDGLCAQSQLELDAAQRLLYVLLITKVLGPVSADSSSSSVRVGTTAQAPSAGTSMAPGARDPAERSRSSGAAWRAIAMRAAQMSTNSPTPAERSPVPPRSPTAASGSHAAVRPQSRPLTPTPSPRPAEAPRRAPSRPLTPMPQTQSAEAPRRPVSRPLTPSPGSAPAEPPRRAPSRPLTPAPRTFSQTPAGAQPRVRPPSRPLTPAPFGIDAPRSTTPSSPVSRVTPRPSPTPVEMLDAAGKVRRVEQLCQRHAYEEALPIIRELVEENRKNAAYLGLLSHVLLGRTADNTIGKDIVETVNQALRIDPDQVHALYTKARCYKRMGKDREALHYFKRTVLVDPHHIDATREARLLQLRMTEKKGKR